MLWPGLPSLLAMWPAILHAAMLHVHQHVLIEMILIYGGSKVEGTEVVQYVVDGRCKGGIRVEQHLLFGSNGFSSIVNTGGCEGARFDGIALTVYA